MRISTKGRYGLVIMTYLARNYEKNRFVSIKEISEYENVSVKYLEKIISYFKNADFLDSCRGSDGGYKLKYEPKHYTIKHILEVSEGEIEVVSCLNSHFKCDKKEACVSMKLWKELNGVIENFLESKTLLDLM